MLQDYNATKRFTLPFLFQNQAGKELLINESLNKLDKIIHPRVKDIVSTLPSSPMAGDIYATDNKIAEYSGTRWEYIDALVGMQILVDSHQEFYYFNGTEWKKTNSITTPTPSQATHEVGDYKYSAVSANHKGWLICDGSEINRATYSNLFTIIGTSFGAGNGSTTFNLPETKGRVVGSIGQGSGLSSRSLGAKVGEESHFLSVAEMPSHSHNLNRVIWGGAGGNNGIIASNQLYVTDNDATKPVTNTGGGQSHNNMQPTIFIGNLFVFSGVV